MKLPKVEENWDEIENWASFYREHMDPEEPVATHRASHPPAWTSSMSGPIHRRVRGSHTSLSSPLRSHGPQMQESLPPDKICKMQNMLTRIPGFDVATFQLMLRTVACSPTAIDKSTRWSLNRSFIWQAVHKLAAHKLWVICIVIVDGISSSIGWISWSFLLKISPILYLGPVCSREIRNQQIDSSWHHGQSNSSQSI